MRVRVPPRAFMGDNAMKLYKYPRTYHFPFSPGIGSDDYVFSSFNEYFRNKTVVITEKMDGENSTVYPSYYHARSIDSEHREYHSWLLNYIKTFQFKLKIDERVCGEYLYAQHSIPYFDLPSYFMVFSIWHGDLCLSWESTVKRCEQLGLVHVPVLYQGVYSRDAVDYAIEQVTAKGGEGVVMRVASGFSYYDFNTSIIKWVRANHVQTDEHWSQSVIIKNGLL